MLTTTVVLLLLGSVSSSELPVDSPDGVQELNGQLSESSHLWSDMIIFSSVLPSKSLSLNCILGPVSPTTINFNRRFSPNFNLQSAKIRFTIAS